MNFDSIGNFKLDHQVAKGNLPPVGLKVLVADDDAYMRSVIGRMLHNLGVKDFQEAANGKDAINTMENQLTPFDLIICDIDMPESDGMEFMRLLAERKVTTPIMVLSAKPASLLVSIETMAKEYGVNVLKVAEKPPTVPLITETLQRCQGVAPPKHVSSVNRYSAEEILAGLENHEFVPFFQPKVEIATRRLRGCEALARWRHPTDGIVAPGAFIGVIEKAHHMDQLTWTMLEQAASWCRKWHDLGLSLCVNLNFSMSLLSDPQLADRIVDIVRAVDLRPEHFILEVTETVAMTNVPQCLESLCRLRLKGFGLSIDDFGTGFSSLQQLSRVPFTELKIDRVFVDGAARAAKQRAVLESSIEIAKKLNLGSVAEGVETEEDWDCLRKLGCEMAQGYYIAKPVNGGEFTNWASSW